MNDSTPTFTRTAFTISRMLDFASEQELTAQTGHEPDKWPAVIVKELLDNALDACESAGIAPSIAITVGHQSIEVADNGPGIPAATIDGILDFAVRISTNSLYCSPTRGQQGNAMMTVIAMPYVIGGSGEPGRVDIETGGIRHAISFSIDRIAQKPMIGVERTPSLVQSGTIVRVHWPLSAPSQLTDAKDDIVQLAFDVGWVNPHADIALDWYGDEWDWLATDPDWKKWKPHDPTSPHWYSVERLRALIAGYITHDEAAGRQRTCREFISEFRGLARTAKQKLILDATGLARAPLTALVSNGGSGREVDAEAVRGLLVAMKEAAETAKPELLGMLGREHFEERFADYGGTAASFRYKRIVGTSANDCPFVVEAAFAWKSDAPGRILVSGINWSAAIGGDPFDLDGWWLGENRAGRGEPIILAVHLAAPGLTFADRGKSQVILTLAQRRALATAIADVTKAWTKQRKAEERRASAASNRMDALARERRVTVKAAAWQVMEKAWLKASSGGRLPTKARQVMYAARRDILELTGKNRLDDQYFTQTLLPDYVAESGVDWDILYDARGDLVEPHTGRRVRLGTAGVRDYLALVEGHDVDDEIEVTVGGRNYPTIGPEHRFGALVYVEKEGFDELFEAVRLAARFDICTMSNKGMSVTASRTLVEHICAEYGIPLLVLHDFDIAGFSIFGTLRSSTRRHTYTREFTVIDIGLRLADVEGLESEPVNIEADARPAKIATLRRHGATEAESDFLVRRGRRVELNAMSSGDLVAHIERKLVEHGNGKVVPDAATLAHAYRRARKRKLVQEAVDAVLADSPTTDAEVPDGLQDTVQAAIAADPARSWDDIVAEIAAADHDDDEEGDA